MCGRLIAAVHAADDRPIVVEPVVFSGSYTYGLAPAWGYTDFSPPGIDADGRIIFAEPGGSMAMYVTRLWSWQNGTFTRIAQTGDAISNLPGVTISGGGYRFHAAGSGAVYFYDNVEPTPYLNAIHSGTVSGGTQALAYWAVPNSMPAPDAPGATMQGFRYHAAINSQGQAAFGATLSGIPGMSEGIFAGTPGSLHAVALGGQPAPGLPGYFFRYPTYPFGPCQLNEAGDIAFNSGLGQATGTTWSYSLWLRDAAGLRPIVVDGQPAPGCPAGTTLREVNQFGLTASGEVVFLGQLYRNGQQIGAGFFAGGHGPIRPLLVPGSPVEVPGVGTAEYLTAFGATFNPQGQYAAYMVLGQRGQGGARTNARTLTGIGLGHEQQARILALSGRHAPGTAPTTTFAGLNFYDPAYRLSLGADGHLAALLDLSVAGTVFTPAHGLFATGPDGDMHPVAVTHAAMRLSCTTMYSPDRIFMASTSSDTPTGTGQIRQVSDNGQLAFYMRTGVGESGIFIAHLDQLRCEADMNCDGRLNAADITAFINAFAIGDFRADFNHDWILNDADFRAFLAAFEAGC